MMPTDESLMLAVRNGEVDQFAVLFERHQKRFMQSLQAPEEFQQRIANDVTGGRATHVEGTPTFFLNGRQLQQIQVTVEYFAAAIDEELKRAR